MSESHRPLLLAVLGSAAYIGLITVAGIDPGGDSLASAALFLGSFLGGAAVSIALGLAAPRVDSVLGIVVLVLALQWGDLDPFPAAVMIGLWLVGLVARSDRRLGRALHARAFELEAGREVYVQEALHSERARIARELHDVVAHHLSVIVIQASAGQRLPADDPKGRELLSGIAELTREVSADLAGLGRLRDPSGALAPGLSRPAIEELMSRAEATGSSVTCRLDDDVTRVPAVTGLIVYRVLQEGLTNAVKHASGAPIDVSITSSGPSGSVVVAVTNAPSDERRSTSLVPGAGRGLSGLRERVTAAGGSFASGLNPEGGWQLSAQLPLRAGDVLTGVSRDGAGILG